MLQRLMPNQEKNVTKFTCWDLNGREIFWSSHQFFLQSRSIFVITFDLSDPQYHALDYWVSQLKNNVPLEPHSPIFLVGTHLDVPVCQQPAYQAHVMSVINTRYELRSLNILGVYFVSSVTKDGITNLRTRIEDCAGREMLIRVPPTFTMLQHLLESHKALQHIQWEQFQELATNCGIRERDHGRVIQFLQEAGTLLRFPDHSRAVEEMIVLDVEWFSSVIYSFVKFCDKYQVSGGLIHREQVALILEPYPPAVHDIFLQLFEKFGILSRLPQRTAEYDRVLFPGSLSEEAPQEFYVPQSKQKQLGARWIPTVPPDMIEHARIYEFRFRPLTLFDWVLVGMNFIKLKLHRFVWKHGILLFRRDNEEERCLITFHYQMSNLNSQCYTLHVRSRMLASDFNGGKPNTLFTEVIKLIESIIDTNFQRLTDGIRRYIPCLHCLRKGDHLLEPYQFSFEDCVRRLTSNDPFVYCFGFPLAERAVLISHMAPDLAFHGYDVLSSEDLGDPLKWTYIDSGGFGKVFRSTYKGQDVAIKELLAESDCNITQDFVEFQKEVHTMR